MKKEDTYPKKCATKHCRGKVNSKTRRTDKCDYCRWSAWKEKNPLKYYFGKFRRRSKDRGKDFTLTFDQFREFAEKTDYMKLKGKSSMSLSIDRIENALGYHWWNIRAITIGENCRKSYTPYFKSQSLPEFDREEYQNLERQYAQPLKNLAEDLGKIHGLGTPEFWAEFSKRKIAMYGQGGATV